MTGTRPRETAPPAADWTPNQPLRGDATDEQIRARAFDHRFGRGSPFAAREFAKACVEAERAEAARAAQNYRDACANIRDALGIKCNTAEAIVGAVLAFIHDHKASGAAREHTLSGVLTEGLGELRIARDSSMGTVAEQYIATVRKFRADAERLDWMESHICRVTRRFADGSEADMEWEENGPDADTLRSTVDSARTADGPADERAVR